MSTKSDKIDYHYYIHSYNGLNCLYRATKVAKLSAIINVLEVYCDGTWQNKHPAIKSFLNHYVTGWINEDDEVDYETALKIMNNEL